MKTFSASSSSLHHSSRYCVARRIVVEDNRRARSTPSSSSSRFLSLRVCAKKKSGFAAELMKKNDDDDKDDGPSTSSNSASKTNETERCPCGSSSSYKSCCRPYHDLERYPADPVTLMKSRFSAYAKGKAKYIVMTTHSENEIKKDGSKTKTGVKVSTLEADVVATCEKVEFYGLKIANEKKKNDTEHLVSFSYNCRIRGQKGFDRGREETQSELSTFRKEEDGKWYFLDGIQGGA
jgi:SEC-C motif-containing protein